jgi:hypothetical protein
MAGDGPLGHMDHVGLKRNLKRAKIKRPILAVTGPDQEKRISGRNSKLYGSKTGYSHRSSTLQKP